MATFNQRSTEQFNAANVDVDPDAISKYFDRNFARLCTHLDLQLIRRRILPHFNGRPSVLDVGAGKGRMTGPLATIASKVVAIEPFADYYQVLADRFTSSPNITVHRATVAEYAARTAERFDLIYIGGALPHFETGEAIEMLRSTKGLLKPGGFIDVHDYGKEDQTDATQKNLILRSPSEMRDVFESAGLHCLYWRRAYPRNPFWAAANRWPNRLTKGVWSVAARPLFFPVWELLAGLNFPHRRAAYFFYVLKPA
jgi:SAM-dependent methyltransferase